LRDAAPPAVTTYTTTEVSELIAKGVIMSRVDTPEVLETVRQYSPQDLDDFGYVPLPARKRLGSSQGWVGMVVFDTPRQQYAKEFIKHMFAGTNLIDFALSYPHAMFPTLASASSDPSYIEGLPHELKPIAEN